MPVDKKGFKNIITSTPQQAQIIKNLSQLQSNKSFKLVVGRVRDIVLNKDHAEFKKVGEYNGLGTIFFEIVGDTSSTSNIAKPLNPSDTFIPVINELVLLFAIPNTNMGKFKKAESYYYSSTVNLWNSPHHNAYPDPLILDNEKIVENTSDDYKNTDAGLVRQTEDGATDIPLNTTNNFTQVTFKENPKIYPLKFYSGDVLTQGRFGNSIRFGSTNQYMKENEVTKANNWSDNKENGTTVGDPIVIIRNGQTETNLPKDTWMPISEDISNDKSSIYLTSTQKINIEVDQQLKRYESYVSDDDVPDSPDTFTGNQVILNSGRLLFNAKNDHIILNSAKTISINALRGFNFETDSNCVIKVGTNILLGDSDADQPVIFGEKFLNDYNQLLDSLSFLCTQLQNKQIWPAGAAVPDATIIPAAIQLDSKVSFIKKQIDNYKSKITFTK